VGFLPTPKTAQTNITIQQNASASSQAPVFVAAPSVENTVRNLVDRFNETRDLLPAPALAPPLESISDDEDEDEA